MAVVASAALVGHAGRCEVRLGMCVESWVEEGYGAADRGRGGDDRNKENEGDELTTMVL